MSIVYVLRLEQGKYYVGSTDDIDRTCKEHRNGIVSAWTNLYKPRDIEKTFMMTSESDEDEITREYMLAFGIDNVRGGAYWQMQIPKEIRRNIEKEFNKK